MTLLKTMKNKIEFFVTARPSWSRVKSLVSKYIEINGAAHATVCLTGPALSDRYGDLRSQMPSKIRVKTFPSLRESSDFASIALSSLDSAVAACQSWANDRPDAVLVVADRVETLGISVAAASMQIPLVHLQGGEISGSIDDKIRDTNSKLADFHLTTNTSTKENLISMGELSENIKVVGCPSIDLLRERLNLKESWPDKSSDCGGVGVDFSTNSPYGVILFHPDTLNTKENELWINKIYDVINQTRLNWFWFWPNPDYGSDRISKILRTSREKSIQPNVRYIRNLSPEKFMDLTIRARIMIGNSSYGIREASFLGLPVINLGLRQSGRQRGRNVLDISDPKNFYEELNLHCKNIFESESTYGNGNSGMLAAKYLSDWQPKLKMRY